MKGKSLAVTEWTFESVAAHCHWRTVQYFTWDWEARCRQSNTSRRRDQLRTHLLLLFWMPAHGGVKLSNTPHHSDHTLALYDQWYHILLDEGCAETKIGSAQWAQISSQELNITISNNPSTLKNDCATVCYASQYSCTLQDCPHTHSYRERRTNWICRCTRLIRSASSQFPHHRRQWQQEQQLIFCWCPHSITHLQVQVLDTLIICSIPWPLLSTST